MSSNVPAWWGMLIMGKAVYVGNRAYLHGISVYLPLGFAVTIKLLYKSKVQKKKEATKMNNKQINKQTKEIHTESGNLFVS